MTKTWTDKLTSEEIAELREGKKAIAEYVQANTAEIRRYHKACEMALDALENHTAIKHPQQAHYRDSAIEALREVLGGKQ